MKFPVVLPNIVLLVLAIILAIVEPVVAGSYCAGPVKLPPIASRITSHVSSTKVRAGACLITPAPLPPSALLVDVRPSAEAQTLWLPEAVQEPSFERIAARSVFRDKPLYVFGSGKDDLRLLTLCKALAGTYAGKVHIVEGGLRALIAAGHKVEGNIDARRHLNLLGPGELHGLLTRGHAELLDASGERASFVLPGGSTRVRLPVDHLAAALRARQKVRFPIIVFLPNGAPWEHWLDVDEGRCVLFYNQGWGTYADYREQQKQMLVAASKPLPSHCERWSSLHNPRDRVA